MARHTEKAEMAIQVERVPQPLFRERYLIGNDL
jgi:hypothetical protein